MYSQDNRKIDRDQFEMVSIDEKIFDKEFEGKPRTFMADAVVRFAKNKTNVVAFYIVALFVLLSIFVPMLSTKDFTSPVVQNVQNLPPRVPLLEKTGFADGSMEVKDVPVDYTAVDPETGLYLPLGDTYSLEFIKEGTLINTVKASTRKEPMTLKGQNVIYLDSFDSATVKSNVLVAMQDAYTFNINIKAISEDTVLSIYIDDSASGLTDEGVLLTQISEVGTFDFTSTGSLNGYIYMVYEHTDFTANTDNEAQVEIIDILISDASGEEAYYFEGYDLSQFNIQVIEGQGGRYERLNGEYTVASFDYYIYNKIFANVRQYIQGSSSATEVGFMEYLELYPELGEEFAPYLQIIEDSVPATGQTVVDIDYTFEAEGVPIRKVNTVTIRYNVFADITTYTFDVEMDGAFYNGFETIPYFWFGTDKDGRDLFGQVWLSLRTSLFLGLVISAINIFVGIIYGAVEGYYGGRVDFVMERFKDYVASFPGLTILTIIYLSYGPGLMLLLIYLTYSGWIGTSSTTRIQFYRYRGREYVLASKSLGASDKRLIFKHILPNGIGIIVTRSILAIPSMIFVEASLSFLGFGIGRGVTLNFGLFKMPGLSLGVILQEGQGSMLIPGRFYQLLIPSVIIIILMISFNMFGNALRDALNPTLRGQE